MNAIIRNDATGRWFLYLPDEPGRPVLIAETREAMEAVIEKLKLRSTQWDSSNDSSSNHDSHAPSPNTSS